MQFADFTVDVQILTKTTTGTNAYDRVVTWTPTDSPGWVIWPATQGSEATQGQDIITDTLVAIAPVGTVISAVDRVQVHGRVYEVQGSPWSWENPKTGTQPGVQVNLKAVTG